VRAGQHGFHFGLLGRRLLRLEPLEVQRHAPFYLGQGTLEGGLLGRSFTPSRGQVRTSRRQLHELEV
jgi:hypothetical protein